ncbi:hypothetical protein EDC04DRAFT_2608979 [Pisolithus marmoratus]|nr:hypothetical protein EDC04DRAFT_2608979 [Pisolithus marmoratus]
MSSLMLSLAAVAATREEETNPISTDAIKCGGGDACPETPDVGAEDDATEGKEHGDSNMRPKGPLKVGLPKGVKHKMDENGLFGHPSIASPANIFYGHFTSA